MVRDALKQKFGYSNVMQIPRLEKIVINMGVGEAVNDRKKVDTAASDLALIAGQKPVVTRARKASRTGPSKLFVLDTNVLLHDPMCLFRFEEHDIYLPMIVLE